MQLFVICDQLNELMMGFQTIDEEIVLDLCGWESVGLVQFSLLCLVAEKMQENTCQ